MAVTKKDVEYIAKLSRLKFTDKEQEEFLISFNQILSHVDLINKINTDNIEPCSNVFALKNVLREDAALPSMDADKLLKNAPTKEDTSYLVPKVVE